MTKTKEEQQVKKTNLVPVKRETPKPIKRAVGDIQEVTYMSDHNLGVLGWYTNNIGSPAWSSIGGHTSLSGWMFAVDVASHEIYEPAKELKDSYMTSSESGWRFPIVDSLMANYMESSEYGGWRFPIVDSLMANYMESSEYGGWRFSIVDSLTSNYMMSTEYDGWHFEKIDALTSQFTWHESETPGGHGYWTSWTDMLTSYFIVEYDQYIPDSYYLRCPILDSLVPDYMIEEYDEEGHINRYRFPMLDALTAYMYTEDWQTWSFPVIDSLTGYYMSYDETLERWVFPAIDNSRVSISARTTPVSGCAATYDIYQGDATVVSNLVGTINIPKDFLVKSAALSTVTVDDQPVAGYRVGDKYIDFVINAIDSSEQAQHIYLNVKDLVDVYTTQQNATQVQLAINANNVISATIVAGSIGTNELSAGAVTTAKLADDAVTSAKILSSAVTTAKIADGAITNAKLGTACVTSDKLDALSSIVLIDTATTGDYAGKRYRLQVTQGRLQVVEMAVPTT